MQTIPKHLPLDVQVPLLEAKMEELEDEKRKHSRALKSVNQQLWYFRNRLAEARVKYIREACDAN